MKFWKYTSAGNDFVVFDNVLNLQNDEIARICDRRFGIGADGVLIFKDSDRLDFEMIYYNADGGEVEMCGNGARALCHFARNVKNIKKASLKFQTQNGQYNADFLDDGTIRMNMSEISIGGVPTDNLFDGKISYIEVGVPHIVLFEASFSEEIAKNIRHDSRFASGVNVNFVKSLGRDKYEVRTFERGVEAETLACGTGITAAGVSMLGLETDASVYILSKGGEFIVEKKGEDYFLTGPTKLVFEGEIERE